MKTYNHVEVKGGYRGIMYNYVYEVCHFSDGNRILSLMWAFKDVNAVVEGEVLN